MISGVRTAARGLALPGIITMLIGCDPKPGDACDRGEAYCTGPKTQLHCDKGVLIETPCKGPSGCRVASNGVDCDFSGNQSGDACSSDDENAATCLGGDAMLVCASRKYQKYFCRGPHGCENAGERALCDASLARVGDPCKADGETACDQKGRGVLTCQARRMTPTYACRGPEGCAIASGKLNCDMSKARASDPCSKEMLGKHACSDDEKGIVVCKDGHFQLEQSCEKEKRCRAESGRVACEDTES